MHTWTSKPAVKARSPAPVRTMDRTFGSCESLMKILERLCHMLLAWVLVWCFLEAWYDFRLVMGEFQSILTRCPSSFGRHGSLHVMFLSDVEHGTR
jgi:hypothetical protein